MDIRASLKSYRFIPQKTFIFISQEDKGAPLGKPANPIRDMLQALRFVWRALKPIAKDVIREKRVVIILYGKRVSWDWKQEYYNE